MNKNFFIMLEIIKDLKELKEANLTKIEREGFLDFYIDNYIEEFDDSGLEIS